MSESNDNPSARIKLPFGAIIAVFLLTLAVWIFFHEMGMPLQGASTTVVAAIMLAIVLVVRWIWLRRRSKVGQP